MNSAEEGKEDYRDKEARPVPLIPESVLDSATQRLFMVSAFVLIQAWKAYDAYILRNDDLRSLVLNSRKFTLISPEWVFFIKYSFLDSIFVWLSSELKIPKLTLKPIGSILVLGLLLVLDCSLVLDIQIPTFSVLMSSIWKQLFPQKELTIEEQLVDSDTVVDQSAHFKGKMTLRYAADSSIDMNPNENNFCLDLYQGKSVEIPVMYETTNELDYLQLKHRDLNNGIDYLNFTHRQIKKMITKLPSLNDDDYDPASANLHMLKVPLTRPGSYAIHAAYDSKGKAIKQQKSIVFVSVCPEASFDHRDVAEKCVGDELGNISINVLGVAPLTLYYEEEINGKSSHIPKSVLVPDESNFKSPLLSRDLYTGKKRKHPLRFSRSDMANISWARARNVVVPIGKRSLEKTGDYAYTINKVIDGFGNIVNYESPKSSKDTYVFVKAHPLPTISLVDSRPDIPILINNRKYLDVKLSHIPCVSCEAPYTVVFKHTPENGGEPTIFTKSFDFNNNARILADKPGTYSIETASSKYCGCRLGSSFLNIRQAKMPNVHVSMDPIVDKCVGTTGFKFNFEFVGSAPFEIGYQISKLDPNDSKRVISTERIDKIYSESTVLEYNFDPPSEGSYAIEFISLSDKYYQNQVRFQNHEHRYITYFKQRPRAYFNKYSKVRKLDACNGGSAKVSLTLEGKAPFNVAYNLIYPDYRVKTFELEKIVNSTVDIQTPALSNGGEYVLTLKRVTDSSNCLVDFKGSEVHINVRNDVPHLRFASGKDLFSLIEGKRLNIPLNAESDSDISLTYQYEPFGGKAHLIHTTIDPTDGLTVEKEGKYTLVSFDQDGCPGDITNKTSMTVKYLPKPTLKLVGLNKMGDAFKAKTVCENGGGLLNFIASGVGPFIIKYDIRYPDGSYEHKTEQQANKKFSLQLRTEKSGTYQWVVKGIYDSVYSLDTLGYLESQRLYHFEPIRITNEVDALPKAHIVNANDDFKTCISSLSHIKQLRPVKLALQGKLPMDVRLKISNDQKGTSEIMKLNRLQSHVVDVYSIYEKMGLGTYYVSVIGVKDASGCISNEFESQRLTIQVNDVPKISHLIEESSVISEYGQKVREKMNSEEASVTNFYCVGDYITYMLNGVPPFTVYYVFNGRKQVAKVNSNYFKRRASQQGEMKILAISDSSSENCMANFSSTTVFDMRPDLKAKVVDLPSVEIVTGDEDIYEGEQTNITMRFTGQPPFKLTYVRTDLSGEGKIVETEVVDNIQDYEYQIEASMEGTYEALEIQDAHCIARNNQI